MKYSYTVARCSFSYFMVLCLLLTWKKKHLFDINKILRNFNFCYPISLLITLKSEVSWIYFPWRRCLKLPSRYFLPYFFMATFNQALYIPSLFLALTTTLRLWHISLQIRTTLIQLSLFNRTQLVQGWFVLIC